MKKPTFITSIACVFIMLLSINMEAQKFNALDQSPMDATVYPSSSKEPNKLVKVVYSRPLLKDRALSTLAPNGKIWRTGANEATNITLYKDMKIGGKAVKAGEYSLFTIPGDKEWTIILNKDINVWGAYSYNETNDVVRVLAPVSSGESLDAFSIAFTDDGTMYLGWGTVRVAVPFTK
ncbi:DUF2911 domain-containing protein [Mariniflexile sp.]|uniref:DUF2911 domain-containing protein n=1 Tax=Mariniflexile sp. TaxID=1979402 RepID=UPI004047BD03